MKPEKQRDMAERRDDRPNDRTQKRTRRSGRGRAATSLLLATLAVAQGFSPSFVAAQPAHERFDESLTLRPLVDGRVHAFAEFSIVSSQPLSSNASSDARDSIPRDDFRLLPRSLIQIARATETEHFSLSLNRGTWDYETWGSPVWWDDELGKVRGEDAVGAGAEVSATIRGPKSKHSTVKRVLDENRSSPASAIANAMEELGKTSASLGDISPAIMDRWKTLTALLAGIFCASLDAADEKVVVRPLLSQMTSPFKSKSRTRNGLHTTSQTLHAFLPSENICTENLTPLLKMLPCKSSAGIAHLLSPHAVFSSGFHGLNVHLKRKSAELDGEEGWEVNFSFQAVFSPMLDQEARVVGKRDWSLSSLFQRVVTKSCPLADSSTIQVHRPVPLRTASGVVTPDHRLSPRPFNWDAPALLPEAESNDDDDERVEKAMSAEQEWGRKEQLFAEQLMSKDTFTYNAKDLSHFSSGTLNIGMQFWPLDQPFRFPKVDEFPAWSSLAASRSVLGSGQESAEVVLRIRNHNIFQEREVLYTESLPWLLKPFLHTLRINVEADDLDEPSEGTQSAKRVYFRDELESPYLLALAHQPPQSREKGFLLEAHLRVPPASTLTLTFDVEKAFLRYTEHLPDAHRGFDLPAAVITPLVGSQRGLTNRAQLQLARIYTRPALLEAAVPDFSMPYNVIIMTSTIIALFFGSVFNNLTRKYQDVKLDA